jgi:opacity protein-like surface antigen
MKFQTLILIVIFLGMPAHAQLTRGSVETSISAALQSLSGSGTSSTNILLSARLGFFPIDRFEIEPEFTVLKPENVNTLYMLNANLAYNFDLPSGTAHPFLLAGYGITNSFPLFNILVVNYDTTVGVLNLGGGMKVFMAKNVAMRVEYRYQKLTGSQSGGLYGYSYTNSIDLNIHTVHVGFSVLL